VSAGDIAVAVTAVLGGVGGLGALLRTFVDRPKVRADAMKIITDTASQQVLDMDARMDKMLARLDHTEARVERLSRYERLVSGWYERHRPYDLVVQTVAQEHLLNLPPLEPFPMWAEDRPGG
jgi:Flp pilus assembly protein CpaB